MSEIDFWGMCSVIVPKVFVIEAEDYHEFSSVKGYFASAAINVNYEEIGLSDKGKYQALFWVGEKTPEIEAHLVSL